MQKGISCALLVISLYFLILALTGYNTVFLTSLPFLSDAGSVCDRIETFSGEDYVKKNAADEPSSLYAKAYCLLDPDTKRVLTGKNENTKLPMASTTKIMTCILALEKGKENQKVCFSSYAASMPDVQLDASVNDTFFLKDLLYSLMLESHNDTAAAIAEAIGGSVEGFAKLMNQKAKSLGLTNTHFVTPNGLDAKGHYTTARELCLLADYALQNKQFRKIIQTKSHSFQTCDGKKSFSVSNKDAFLNNYSGAIGVKTGFTGNAGYCFCGAAKRGKKLLITSVLACGWPPHKNYKWADTSKLMNYGFENFQTVKITPQKDVTGLSVKNGTKKELPVYYTSPDSLCFSLSSKDTLTHKTTFAKSLCAPVRKDALVGREIYYINDTKVAEYPVYAKETADVCTFAHCFHLLFDFLFTAR